MKFANRFDSKTWNEDKGYESNLPSVTDQAWRKACSVSELINSSVQNENVYGEDDYSYSYEEKMNEVNLVKRSFDMLSEAKKKKFGNIENYFQYLMTEEKIDDKVVNKIEERNESSIEKIEKSE